MAWGDIQSSTADAHLMFFYETGIRGGSCNPSYWEVGIWGWFGVVDFVSGYSYHMSVRTSLSDHTKQTKFQSQWPNDVETPVPSIWVQKWSNIGTVSTWMGDRLEWYPPRLQGKMLIAAVGYRCCITSWGIDQNSWGHRTKPPANTVGVFFAPNFIQNLYTVLKKRLWESRSTPTLSVRSLVNISLAAIQTKETKQTKQI
jgi:hypothetical protein